MKRLQILDVIRGISILFVVLAHASSTYGFPEQFRMATEFIFDGSLGVRVFFVLSGYLITTILVNEQSRENNISLKRFYLKRCLRILPVYYLFILFIFLADYLSVQINLSASNYIQAITFTTGLWGQGSWLLGHTWSLSVEEQFYFFWPVLLIYLSKLSQKRFLYFCIITIPIIRGLFYYFKIRTYDYSFLTQGDAIMIGCLLALLMNEQVLRFNNAKIFIFSVLVIYLIKIPSVFLVFGFFSIPFTFTIQSFAIAYIIGFCIEKKSFEDFSNIKLTYLVKLGTISYSLYLWQQLFLDPSNYLFNSKLFFPLNILLSILVGFLSYFTVERLILRFRNRINL